MNSLTTRIVILTISVTITTICPSFASIHQTKFKFGYRPNVEICVKNITNQQLATSDQANNNIIPHFRCITLNHPICLDFSLPYKATFLPQHIPELSFADTEEVENYLHRWKVYRGFPKCWPHLKNTLCSILMPECVEDTVTGRAIRVSKPNVDMCFDVMKNCKFLHRHFDWPSIFNCSDSNLYGKNCSNELKDTTSSSSLSQSQAICQYPLVPSNESRSWFKDIEGCTTSCKHPISNLNDQDDISFLIKALCSLGLLSTFLAIILFETAERYRRKNKKTSYLAKVIKRCVICQFVWYVGWSLQMFFNNNLACSGSGSTLSGLTLAPNGCVLSFLLTYLPSLSILFWSAYLGRLCYERLIGNRGENQAERGDLSRIDLILNCMSFGLPSILFITVALLSQIDGHGLYGICTVGQQSIVIKCLFVFIPKVIGTFYGNYYFLMTIFKLMKVREMKPILRRNFFRITILAILNFMDVIFSVWNYFYNHLNEERWIKSIDNYLACNLNLKSIHDESYVIGQQECTIEKPMITLYLLELFSTLSIGIVIASWAFCESNLKALRLMIIDLLEDDEAKQRGKTSFHDPIDCMSPTRTNDRELELHNNMNNHEESVSITNNSLASATISFASSFQKIPRRQHQSTLHNASQPELSARDVINDQRLIEEQRRLAEAAPLLSIEQTMAHILSDNDALAKMNMIACIAQEQTRNLDVDIGYQFIHGMADKSQ